MTNIIDGRSLAYKHQQALIEKIKTLKKLPKIVSVLVGDNPASVMYTSIKQKKSQELGIDFSVTRFPEGCQFEEVVDKIKSLNADKTVDGIMIQLPSLPGLIDLIDPQKDVDGLTGKGNLMQATIRGVLSIIDAEEINLSGKNIVVGAKGIVGKGIVKALDNLGVEVVEVDEDNDLSPLKDADLIISCVGKNNLITGRIVKIGVVIIDVGGDVNFEEVSKKAAKITPTPGGVGPMTVISLMENAVDLVSGNLTSSTL